MADASLQYRKGFKAIHDVLLHEWDPIGVGDEPAAKDEYDSYIPEIYRLLTERAELLTIALHLGEIQSVSMGLPVSMGLQGDLDKNIRIAKRLREVIESSSQQLDK